VARVSVLEQISGVDAGAAAPRSSALWPVAIRMARAATAAEIPAAYGRPIGPSSEALVELLRAYVIAHIGRRLSTAEIVAVTRLSESTVRRALEAETGQHLAEFILNIKLDRARAWLSTNRESRNQMEIAAALGFSSAVAFGRSYRKRFGESMSVTRRRAVQMSGSSGVVD